MSATGVIPVDNTVGWYTLRITLGSAVYVLTIRYNSRMALWVLDISDANNNLIKAGIPIVGGVNLLSPWQGTLVGLPPGVLFTLDLTGANLDPSLTTFGSTNLLYYWEPGS